MNGEKLVASVSLREVGPCLKGSRAFHRGGGWDTALISFHPQVPKCSFLISLGSTGPNIYVMGILSSLDFAEQRRKNSFLFHLSGGVLGLGSGDISGNSQCSDITRPAQPLLMETPLPLPTCDRDREGGGEGMASLFLWGKMATRPD